MSPSLFHLDNASPNTTFSDSERGIGYDPSLISVSKEFWDACVLGYLVDYRRFNASLLSRLIDNQWDVHGTITVYKMGNLYVLHCSDEMDKLDIISRNIVVLEGALMVFQEWRPYTLSQALRFTCAWFWVRVCGLPFDFLNMHIATMVGNLFGGSFEMEQFDNVPNDDYLRIRVEIQLQQPLIPGFFIALDDGYMIWAQLKYEELQKICIRCGCIGHKVNGCVDTESKINSSLDHAMSCIGRRGFHILQSINRFTNYHLDLRASPTSRITASRSRLRDHKDYRNIDILKGDKVYPGTRFTQEKHPFTGPVFHPLCPPEEKLFETDMKDWHNVGQILRQQELHSEDLKSGPYFKSFGCKIPHDNVDGHSNPFIFYDTKLVPGEISEPDLEYDIHSSVMNQPLLSLESPYSYTDDQEYWSASESLEDAPQKLPNYAPEVELIENYVPKNNCKGSGSFFCGYQYS